MKSAYDNKTRQPSTPCSRCVSRYSWVGTLHPYTNTVCHTRARDALSSVQSRIEISRFRRRCTEHREPSPLPSPLLNLSLRRESAASSVLVLFRTLIARCISVGWKSRGLIGMHDTRKSDKPDSDSRRSSLRRCRSKFYVYAGELPRDLIVNDRMNVPPPLHA